MREVCQLSLQNSQTIAELTTGRTDEQLENYNDDNDNSESELGVEIKIKEELVCDSDWDADAEQNSSVDPLLYDEIKFNISPKSDLNYWDPLSEILDPDNGDTASASPRSTSSRHFVGWSNVDHLRRKLRLRWYNYKKLAVDNKPLEPPWIAMKNLSTVELVERGIPLVTRSKLFICRKCPTLLFETGEDKRRHCLEMHRNDKLKKKDLLKQPKPCSKCGRHFRNIGEQKAHNVECMCFCYFCQREIGQRKGFYVETYIEHMRIHTGEKPLNCDKCDFASAHLSSLRSHQMLKHEKCEPKICDLCGKSFKTSSTLWSHKNIRHTNGLHKTKFPCPICPKTFSARNVLQKHIDSIHQSIRSFHCERCKLSFKLKDNYHRHLKNHNKPGFRIRHKHNGDYVFVGEAASGPPNQETDLEIKPKDE